MTRFILVFFLLLSWSCYAQEPVQDTDCESCAQVEESAQSVEQWEQAQNFLRQHRFEEAEDIANRVLDEDPMNVAALRVVTKSALGLGRLADAQTYLDRLFSLDQKNPENSALQGLVCLYRGEMKSSVEHLERALVLGKDIQSSTQLALYANTLVLAYYRDGRSKEALASCEKFLQDYPEDPGLYLTASRLYREDKNFASALEVAEKGLKVDPNFYTLHASVALAQLGLGNKTFSEEAYLRLKAADPELAKDLRATLDGTRADTAEYKLQVE